MTKRPLIVYLRGGRKLQGDGLEKNLPQWASVAIAKTIAEMLDLLSQDEADVVLFDWYFSDGTWKDALREIRARHPKLPAIVISPTQGIDEGIQEWLEVLNAGAFDLLLAPSNPYSVLAMLEQAVSSGQRRRLQAVV